MHTLLTKLGAIFLSLAFSLGAVHQTPQTFGAVTPVSASQFTLAGAGINSTQTTIQLSSFTTPDGRPIVMTMLGSIGYGALEPQTTAKLEDVTFSGVTQNTNGTATLTGVTRGNDFVTPYAASTTLAKAHAGGATFILTNTAGFYTQFASLANTESITGVWTFASTSAPQYDANYTASGNQFVSYNQLNNVVVGGAGTSTENALGLVQLSSAANTGVGTASSSTGAPLVIENKFATTTPGTLCTGGAWKCIVASTLGKISQAWIDLTASFTFSGGLTSTATTTLAGSNVNSNAVVINTIKYAFPSSQGVANTRLTNDGSGNLSWTVPSSLVDSSTTPTTLSASTATTTVYKTTVPANVLGTSNAIRVRVYLTGMNLANTNTLTIEAAYGNASTTLSETNGTGSGVSWGVGYLEFLIQAAGTTGSQATVATYVESTGGLSAAPKTVNDIVSKTISVDSTAAQSLVIAASLSATGAGQNFTPARVTTELLHN